MYDATKHAKWMASKTSWLIHALLFIWTLGITSKNYRDISGIRYVISMLGLSHNQITMLIKYVCSNYEKRIPAKHKTPIERRINAGPPSTALAQHRLNTRWTSRACWDVSKRKRKKSVSCLATSRTATNGNPRARVVNIIGHGQLYNVKII